MNPAASRGYQRLFWEMRSSHWLGVGSKVNICNAESKSIITFSPIHPFIHPPSIPASSDTILLAICRLLIRKKKSNQTVLENIDMHTFLTYTFFLTAAVQFSYFYITSCGDIFHHLIKNIARCNLCHKSVPPCGTSGDSASSTKPCQQPKSITKKMIKMNKTKARRVEAGSTPPPPACELLQGSYGVHSDRLLHTVVHQLYCKGKERPAAGGEDSRKNNPPPQWHLLRQVAEDSLKNQQWSSSSRTCPVSPPSLWKKILLPQIQKKTEQ